MFRRNLFLISLLILFQRANCYLPGLYPITYCTEDSGSKNCHSTIPVYYNSLVSKSRIIPLKYSSLNFCVNNDETRPVENLGQILFGEKYEVSSIKLRYLKEETCQLACEKDFSPNDLQNIYKAIKNRYQNRITIDDLPVVIQFSTLSEEKVFNPFVPLGCFKNEEGKSHICEEFINNMLPNDVYLFNHIDILVHYHKLKDGEQSGRIVFIMASLKSYDQSASDLKCTTQTALVLNSSPNKNQKIPFTYSVSFKENENIAWSSRWDYLLLSSRKSKIQWLSIINSLVIVIFLSGLVAFIFIRTLRRDISRYNELVNNVESQEDFGWKLLHGDVFRPPRFSMLLCVFTGFGLQLSLMAFFTLFIALIAFSSPAYRGTLLTTGMAIFVLLGSVAGYVSARLYKFMGGLRWKLNVLMTSTLCPAIVFFIFIILDITLAATNSSAAISFPTMLSLLSLWLFVSLPLCYLGAFFGFRKETIKIPVLTNQIPRQIPNPSPCLKYCGSILLSGSLPFGCIFVQLFLIFSSIWGNEIHYMFGLIFLVFLIMIIVCSLTSILMTYLQLCSEDYRWWWKSFLSVGSSAICVFVNSIHFYLTKLEFHDSTSTFLYFGYMTIICFLFFLLTGTIGVISSFMFIRKIYSVVKVD